MALSYCKATSELLHMIDESYPRFRLKQVFMECKKKNNEVVEEFEKANKIDPQILNAFSAYANDLTEIMYLHMPYQQNRVFDEKGISPALTRHNSDFIIKQRSRGKNKGANLKICPTISSNAFQENNLLDGVRRLTEIECERLQGFPDNWTQYGDYNGTIKPIARTQRYKLIGNAVTVDIVELIAKRLKFIKNEKPTCNRIRRA